MFHVAVCDDNKIICEKLRDIIKLYGRKNYIDIKIDMYASIQDFIQQLENGAKYNLIFLDIAFPKEEENGVSLAELIRNELSDDAVQLVFISASEDYYKELLEVRPMHFLLKPFTDEQVERDVKKAIELTDTMDTFFTYQKNKTRHRIPLKEILYFESIGRQIRIKWVGGEDFFYGKLSGIKEQLRNKRFCTPSKSYFVRYDCIEEFTTKTIRLKNGQVLDISRNFVDKMMEYQMQYEREV